MEVFLYILVLFLLIILLIIFLPINLVLSTDKGMIGIFYGKWISAGIYFVSDEIKFIWCLAFWKKEIDFIQYMATEYPSSRSKKNLKKERKTSSSISKAMLKRLRKRWKDILDTFQLKEMEAKIDTDDYIVNAYLFPIIQYLGNKFHRPLKVNFIGVNKIELRIQNRIANLLFAFFR